MTFARGGGLDHYKGLWGLTPRYPPMKMDRHCGTKGNIEKLRNSADKKGKIGIGGVTGGHRQPDPVKPHSEPQLDLALSL